MVNQIDISIVCARKRLSVDHLTLVSGDSEKGDGGCLCMQVKLIS